MLPLYFLAQIFALLCGWPFLLFLYFRRPDKFRRLYRRLYLGLDNVLGADPGDAPSSGRQRIWLHALSVGEVSSALPLARAIRQRFPDAFFLVTVATATGEEYARKVLADTADVILPSPIDCLPSLWRFLRSLRPNLFIQVETDFWPGLLFSLRRRNIPTLLVNGRISARSFSRYRRLRALFLPMFSCFSLLAMQSEADRDKMLALGLPAARLPVLGNLKYAADQPALNSRSVAALVPPGCRLWVCGSTHPGEEEILLAAYCRLRDRFPDLFLLLAPRRIERGQDVAKLAVEHGLTARLRSRRDGAAAGNGGDVLILDSIGELAACYFLADVVFIGGSLVAEGGHNPLEAAWAGKPILFGPHMEDFSEIAHDLIAVGAAHAVADTAELTAALTALLTAPGQGQEMGATALAFVQAKLRGIVDGHLDAITTLLTGVNRQRSRPRCNKT